jgi:outer membrane protein
MKKLLVLISFVLLASTTSLFAQANAKLGYINTAELMQVMPGIDTVESGLKDHQTQLEQTIQTMVAEYQSKAKNYQDNAAAMSQIIRQTKEKEINDLQSRIQQFQKTAEQDFQRKRQELLKPILDRAKKAIEKIANANGYIYIFDVSAGSLIVYEKGDNIMAKVKAELKIK